MKKFLFATLTALLLWGCSEDRNNILKVYNWADYIDEELIGEFEQWYEEQTGEKVEVVYQTFDINETMLSKIELGHEDYDVACPSDYIIERMLRNNLLLPINRDFGDTPDYIGNVSPYIQDEVFSKIEGGGRNANDYAVGYMWGTTGLLYNPKYVSDEDVKTWEVLRNPEFAGKILIKDAFRDVYTSLLISFYMDKIESGQMELQTIGFDASAESIAMVEEYLNSFKDNVAGWEADFGKDQMTKELAWLNLSWSGDAQWAIDEAAEIGLELKYAIPETGSSVWFDGWVIPKYAKNIKAASYFINYMCMPENAVRNMDVSGYVSTIGGMEILEAMSDPESFDPIDVTYFFGEEADSVCVNPVMYPDKRIMSRCGMMHDSGTEELLKMWSRVKGDSASVWTYILICIVFLSLIAALIVKYAKKRYRRRRYAMKRRKRA
ncbi:MAG: ABC transporter substrate-binding protein [Bacteroidales bacterium]|nr:ABC transporter substrate-binding protein [Bacteroidales bacterium]